MKNSKKSTLITKADIDASLVQAPVQGKHLLEPFKAFDKANSLPMNILEDMAVDNKAEVHTHEADLWLCMEGEVTFVHGGELVDSKPKDNKDGTFDNRELSAEVIKGGTEVVLKAGDWPYIPGGEPHKHKKTGVARLVIIKIPEAK